MNQKHDIHFDKNEIDQIEKPSVKDEEIYDEDLIEDFFIKDQGLNQCCQLTVWKFKNFTITQILREIIFEDS